ncbi:hypothetical protein [Bacillus sp. FSL K6-6540]|uniref:hypothetical protein n=1 Tax=Bacillus sp. FSL K6-6540 TaxID=2921512 RepID=UPI0030FA5240
MKTFTILYMENNQEISTWPRNFLCGQDYEVIWRTGLDSRSPQMIETIRRVRYRVRT